MKFFCKKFLKEKLAILLYAGLVLFLAGCSESDSGDPDLYPDNGLAFWMFPNDGAVSDSVAANLAHGVILEVHAGATYTLSFDADTLAGAPTLQLFRLHLNSSQSAYSARRVRTLKPTLVNGRYEYSFLCEERDAAEWAATLEKDDTFYKGSTRNVRLSGDGAYSDHLSLNLVLVGNVAKKLQGFTVDELASNMLAQFRRFYTGIVIDTLYVNYAENHPVNGTHYPPNEPWVAGRSDSDIMMQKLGGSWPGADKALDLVLVHYVDEVGLMGYSFLFSGNLGGGEGSTVVLGAHVKTPSGTVVNSMADIVETAVHESGHFLGLRHTTASHGDIQATGDFSMIEDGLSDTPFCKGLLQSGLVKKKAFEGTDMKVRYGIHGRSVTERGGEFDIYSCPDATNLMFPVSGQEYGPLTEQQQNLVRKTLMIYPH